MTPAPEEAAAPAVTKPVPEEPVQDNPEPEPISNGNGSNGTVDHDAEDKPVEEDTVEKMETEEPETTEEPEAKVEEESVKEDEAPKDAFDQMVSKSEEETKEPDSFDKMLEAGDEDKKEESEVKSGSEEAKPDEPKEDSEEKPAMETSESKENEKLDESTEKTEEASEESKVDKDESETKEKGEEKKDSFDEMLSGEDGKTETEVKDETKEESGEKDPFNDLLGESSKKDAKADDSEEKKEEDSFDKMLSGEPEEKKEEDDSEDKKETTEGGPATTIDADALDETVTEEKMDDNDTPEVIAAITSEKVLSDEEYYETHIKAEEKEFLENPDNLPTIDSICAKLTCSVCSKALDPVFGNAKSINRHPHLGIPVCRECRKFYGDGDWPSTEDGDEYCRVCGQGGDILLCDKCPNAFRRQCIQRMFGARALREITKSEEWNCLVCDPKPLYPLKAIYYCVYKKQEEFKTRRDEEIKKEKDRQAARRARAGAPTNKEKEDLVKSPKNFLEENISEAFKTLDVYQKSLETERTRCIKTVKEGMTVEMATSITRKLRKLYAVTQKNMDLLDRAIVESFVENYPTESTRIHMGRVERNDPPTPVKRTRPSGSSKQKIKIKAKNKKGKAGKAGNSKVKVKGKKHIRMNGSPVYREAPYVPSLMKKPSKKRRNDSDVECIDVSEEDDDYRPKKKFRPGPASSKKAKPGPASRKAGPKSRTY